MNAIEMSDYCERAIRLECSKDYGPNMTYYNTSVTVYLFYKFMHATLPYLITYSIIIVFR